MQSVTTTTFDELAAIERAQAQRKRATLALIHHYCGPLVRYSVRTRLLSYSSARAIVAGLADWSKLRHAR